ncbi:MAG: hypothetical protein IPK72_13230 [Candidatus Eisenbacteria bacterium]|nr:hypothetical protein [Candidatus Eisenbacteria bacterium]
MAGLFLGFEGTEGAGKTTQIDRLAHDWSAPVTPSCGWEPGGTEIGSGSAPSCSIEAIPDGSVDRALSLRREPGAARCANRILPALEAGAIVLCDRFGDASVAYQGADGSWAVGAWSV